MKRLWLTPKAVLRRMLDRSGKSNADVSRSLGNNRTFVNEYTTRGKTPSFVIFVRIATVCGYEVHLVGHDEDITVTVNETD